MQAKSANSGCTAPMVAPTSLSASALVPPRWGAPWLRPYFLMGEPLRGMKIVARGFTLYLAE
jgi:hypothetical protein